VAGDLISLGVLKFKSRVDVVFPSLNRRVQHLPNADTCHHSEQSLFCSQNFCSSIDLLPRCHPKTVEGYEEGSHTIQYNGNIKIEFSPLETVPQPVHSALSTAGIEPLRDLLHKLLHTGILLVIG